MEGENRRTKIIEKLSENTKPISGRSLAKEFDVSRQIIVGDIALIRAQGINIVATNSGYVIEDNKSAKSADIRIKHRPEDFFDVLCTIVDEGASISELYIEHDVYGVVRATADVKSRADARILAERTFESSHAPLYELTGNVYFLKVEASADVVLIRVQRALHEKGYISR